MSTEKTIYLVDDEAELRKALHRLLSGEGFSVREFASADEFLAHLPSLADGCVLLDVAMPGIDGLEAQRQMGERGHALPIVFLTGQGGIPESVRAVKAGAVDFLAKPVRREDLLQAIAAAFEQIQARRHESGLREHLLERVARLTPREREVFAYVIAGLKNKIIARQLGVAEQTIKVHRSRVMEKLEAKSVADLVRLASLADVAPAG